MTDFVRNCKTTLLTEIMDELPSHAKRKKYDASTYARLLHQLTQLIEEVPKLRPNRNEWDIEGDWAATGTIHFVEAVHQPLFESIRHFDCRTIKLVNLDRPAARMTFYRKHRYWLLKHKDLTTAQKVEFFQTHIDELSSQAQSLEDKLTKVPPINQVQTKAQIGLYWQQVNTWQDILANPQRYELAISNYARQHYYVTLNYKYHLPAGEYANQQEHLLNHQRDRAGNITQLRYNIIFIDAQEILREHPYQNREVEAYLATFPIQSEPGRQTLYARLRPETPALE